MQPVNKVRFLGLGYGDFSDTTLDVAYIAVYARASDGACALCHGDACNDSSPPESDIARFYKSNPEASTCPVCDGRAT